MSKPETVFKAGAVKASVFVNTIERDEQVVPNRKVVIEVRYRDKAGQWQGTNSLSLNEVPKAITALQQAYEYLLSRGSQEYAEPTANPPETTSNTIQRTPNGTARWGTKMASGNGWRSQTG